MINIILTTYMTQYLVGVGIAYSHFLHFSLLKLTDTSLCSRVPGHRGQQHEDRTTREAHRLHPAVRLPRLQHCGPAPHHHRSAAPFQGRGI